MTKSIEHVHWPDAPDMWMPYAPAITVEGGKTVFLAGVTAAPVYHHHPHRPEEFDTMPRGMEGQASANTTLLPVWSHHDDFTNPPKGPDRGPDAWGSDSIVIYH